MEMIRAGTVGGRPTFVNLGTQDGYIEFEIPGDTEWDHKGRTMISQIYISYNNLFITSIRFGYLENGTLVLSDKYGPSDGHSFRVVTLNENEYVTGLSGAQGKCGGIRNLTFHTNCGKHGPFGHDGIDASFIKIEIDPGIRDRRQFGGFFGSYRDECVSGIGLYFSPILSSQRVVKDENM